jgi:hypothetical protein
MKRAATLSSMPQRRFHEYGSGSLHRDSRTLVVGLEEEKTIACNFALAIRSNTQ